MNKGVEMGEKLILNLGPSHPSTHGVLRVILELDGEIVTRAMPDIGYLHRGDEKIADNMTYNQYVPYTDRLDYLAPLANNVAYALAVEKLMGWTVPPRGQVIRVICCELARISAHLLGMGALAMDCGAMTVFLYIFTEREKIYNLIELLTGARFTTSYTRIGGLIRDLPPGFVDQAKAFVEQFKGKIDELDTLLTRNKIFVDRNKGIGIISKEDAVDFGLTGPNLRGSGVSYDLRKDKPYLTYSEYSFSIPTGSVGDAYDRYLCRLEELRQSVHILEQALRNIPVGPINVVDGKGFLPGKDKVLTKMEELIHHFILVTEGVQGTRGRSLFRRGKSEGRAGFLHQQQGRRRALPAQDSRALLRQPGKAILSKLLPGHMMSDVVAILGSLDFKVMRENATVNNENSPAPSC